MNRRNFLQLSGTTTAALFFARLTFAQQDKHVINIPDALWIQSGDDWYKLTTTNQSLYQYKDVVVTLQHTGGVLSVKVSSPTMPLNAVKLVWKHDTTTSTKCLVDHWERTYGDVGWLPASNKKMPWYFIQHDETTTNCFGVKTGANSICYWQLNDDGLQLVLDTRCGGAGVMLGNRTLHAADIVTMKSKDNEKLFATAQRFCKLMCDKPVLPKQPVYGINDWYFAYGNNSYDLIVQHTSMLADLVTDHNNKPFSVIDAGWAKYSPYFIGDSAWQDDFSMPNDKFKDMHKMADAIQQLGMRPGLWTRPLCGKHDDPSSLILPLIPGRDNPKAPVLDPSIEENLARVKHNVSLYKQWGYHLVKHDFTTFDMLGKWGFEMTDDITTKGWHFNDTSKTTAEITSNLYKTIRDAAQDMYLIGCNTFSHLSAGLFELNRIGDDTSGKEWARTRKMGVNTLAFRMPQHNHFYAADGDCVGLTKDVAWDKNKQWMQLLAESSAPLFISVQPDALGAEQKQFIKQSFAQAAATQPVGQPMDWYTNMQPKIWQLNGREVRFDWD
jgi:alpha-galactosidase